MENQDCTTRSCCENLSEGQEPSTPVESDLAEAPADQQVEPQSEPSEA